MGRVTWFIALGLICVVGLYLSLNATLGVGFYYPVPLDNNPLDHPVAVTSVSSNKLLLADGRVLTMEFLPSETDLSEMIRESGFHVDVEPVISTDAYVYVKKRTFICGTHAPRIVIPLFPNNYPAYHRQLLGSGSVQ